MVLLRGFLVMLTNLGSTFQPWLYVCEMYSILIDRKRFLVSSRQLFPNRSTYCRIRLDTNAIN